MWFTRYGRVLAVGVGIAVLVVPAVVHAQQATSPNYSVNEVYFGPGSNINAGSANYSANQTAGNTTVGQTGSANYTANTGSNTNRNESLAVTASPSSTDLGVLKTNVASTATTAFSVISYLSSGYTVTVISDPPSNNTNPARKLANLTTPTGSTPGTEQFGINLAANTSPVSVGAAPQQAPDSTFGYGAARTGYNTANAYKYVKGDIIAGAAKSSGTTNYTISYLYNISSGTPSGLYTYVQQIVVTASF